MNYLQIFFCVVISCLIPTSGTMALDIWKTDYPPTSIEVDQEILRAIAKKCNAKITGGKVPFAGRLSRLKAGEIDIMAGLLKKPDRQDYIYFLNPPYKRKTNKYFFMRKGEENLLKSYDDLYSISVGVQIDSKYFSPFDEDSNIKKYSAPLIEGRFKMLVLNRLDAVIHTDVYGIQIIQSLGLQDKVAVAPYRYTSGNPVYIGISRKSDIVQQKDLLEAVLSQMIDSGELARIIHTYFTLNNLPVPEFN